MQEVSFTVDGQKLEGTILYPKKVKEKNPAILFLHGWMSKRTRSTTYAQTISELGYICLTYDMRSHGESEGDRKVLSRKDYLNDAIAAYDFLKRQPSVDPANISVVGSSFGSYIATLLSAERPVSQLILRVPANYPEEGFTEPQPKYGSGKTTAWRKIKLAYTENRVLRALHVFIGKVLLIESENDLLVPHQTIENYAQAVSIPTHLTTILMPGADHSLQTEKQQKAYVEILFNWFKKKA